MVSATPSPGVVPVVEAGAEEVVVDEERAAIRNEKRQDDNQPFGRVYYRILKGLFPPGHPYRHPTVGSIEDLEAASLEDMQQWFREYYGAANTVLVMAGDIEPAEYYENPVLAKNGESSSGS